MNFKSIRKGKGFTLVELMVSIVLALFLAIVAGQSYLSTKTTYRATEQNARIQENLRFATHFINREVRQAGNIGCFQTIKSHLSGPAAADQLSIDALYDPNKPINVWSYNNSDDFDLSVGNAYNLPAAGNQWQDATSFTRPLPAILAGQVMEGSDIISVTKISEPLSINLNNTNNLTDNELDIAQLNNNSIPTGQVLLVGDCNSADLFVHTGAQQDGAGVALITKGNSNLTVSNSNGGADNWQRNWGPTAEVRLVESTLFFIGQGASDLPALFKLDLGNGGAAGPLEIVDGIELMRGLVGLDSDTDNLADLYLRIDEMNAEGVDYADIRSLQIGLLAVGTENTNIDGANDRTFQLTQRHQVTSPNTIPDEFSPEQAAAGLDDTRYRQSTTVTIELRNAGLARKPEVF